MPLLSIFSSSQGSSFLHLSFLTKATGVPLNGTVLPWNSEVEYVAHVEEDPGIKQIRVGVDDEAHLESRETCLGGRAGAGSEG